jgi:hypothetical protein
MMAIDPHDESFNAVEIGDEGEASRAPGLPQGLKHLNEQERAQGMSLRQLFAEQEHGLRQMYPTGFSGCWERSSRSPTPSS